MAELEQRSLEEVKALSVEEAVEIMRQAGIVGAGGGGFPTYFKYKAPLPHLLVNATESYRLSTSDTELFAPRFPWDA